MSRIGRKPIMIPEKVKISVKDGHVEVQGPGGMLKYKLPDSVIDIVIDSKTVRVQRKNEARRSRALHGLTRTLISNMVTSRLHL